MKSHYFVFAVITRNSRTGSRVHPRSCRFQNNDYCWNHAERPHGARLDALEHQRSGCCWCHQTTFHSMQVRNPLAWPAYVVCTYCIGRVAPMLISGDRHYWMRTFLFWWSLLIINDSSAVPKAVDFGISADNVFGFWDWVGGRYSVCSAVGVVPLALQVRYLMLWTDAYESWAWRYATKSYRRCVDSAFSYYRT